MGGKEGKPRVHIYNLTLVKLLSCRTLKITFRSSIKQYLAEVPSQECAVGIIWFQKGEQQVHQLPRRT